jgi:thioredoxin-like negative regulator of GroEL
LHRIDVEERPDLAERFGVAATPTLIVVVGKHVTARLEQPHGVPDIRSLLEPWLR